MKNGRKTDGVAFRGELLAEFGGKGRDGIEFGDPVAVEGLGELAGAEDGLAEVRNQRAKLFNRKAKERLHQAWCSRLNRFPASGV